MHQKVRETLLFWRDVCGDGARECRDNVSRVGQHPYFSIPFAVEDSFPLPVAVYIYLLGFEFVQRFDIFLFIYFYYFYLFLFLFLFIFLFIYYDYFSYTRLK